MKKIEICFTQKIFLRKRIVIDSHNYFQPDGFNTSNFLVFDFDTAEGFCLVTTNYDIYHNVIGFRLVRTTIRTPPFNINSTNNISLNIKDLQLVILFIQ